MPTTCTGCSVTVPTLATSCGQNKKPGGIPYLAFVACDDATILATPTDLAVWQAAVTANDARVVKNLLGELPKANASMKRFQSCFPEGLQGKNYTLNVQDYDFQESGSPLVAVKENFYNDIQADPTKYNLYYGSCDGRMWLVPNFVLVMDVVVPNNNVESRYMDINIMFQGQTMGTQYIFDLGTV